MVATLLTLTFPLLTQRLVDSAVVDKAAAALTTIALTMVGVFLVQAVFNFGQSYLLSFTGERLVADPQVNLQHPIVGMLVKKRPDTGLDAIACRAPRRASLNIAEG